LRMSKNKLIIFLVVSLAFNMAVLAVFAFHRLGEESEGSVYCDHQQCRMFARNFGLHPSRVDRFATEMSRFREDEIRLRGRIREARMDLMGLFQSSSPDSAKIIKQVDQISELQGELEKIMIRRLLRVNSVLSDSERVKFHRILMHRMRGERHPHPRGRKIGGSHEEF